MIDIENIHLHLPRSHLEPEALVSISGLNVEPNPPRWRPDWIHMLEPPCNARVPYVDPKAATALLLEHYGASWEDAESQAAEIASQLVQTLSPPEWIQPYDAYDPDAPILTMVYPWITWLEQHNLVPQGATDFLSKAADVATVARIFHGQGSRREPWSLQTIPGLTTPKSMIEFAPGPPWWVLSEDANQEEFIPRAWGPYLTWREEMKPVADSLNKELGKPVAYFGDLTSDIDDDDLHRNFVLHWCCTICPESAFVQFLLKLSGAVDVESLKTALVRPEAFSIPFELYSSFFGMEVLPCRMTFRDEASEYTVGLVIMSAFGRSIAESYVLQQINSKLLIVGPPEVLDEKWADEFARHSTGVIRQFGIDDPIETLCEVDELFVFADRNRENHERGPDLCLQEDAELLLHLALERGVPSSTTSGDGYGLFNPENSIRESVKLRAQEADKSRQEFTTALNEIRFDYDYGSSGLWNERGQMLGADQIDAPFSVLRDIKRLALSWEVAQAPDSSRQGPSESWWRDFNRRELDLATALRSALPAHVTVSVHRDGRWQPVTTLAANSGR